MEKRYEITLVIVVLCFVCFLMLYKGYFNTYCEGMSGNNESNYLESIHVIADCKDSLVCEYTNPVMNNKNEVTTWTCEKRIFNRLEWDFYKQEFNKYF